VTRAAAALALALAPALVAQACSDEPATAPRATAVDAGSDAPRRAAPPVPSAAPPSGPTRTTCLAACGERNAAGKAKDDAIGACWSASCAGACTRDVVDAGLLGDAGACALPVTTGDEACDRCTRERCCAAWDGCFGDEGCAAFNACARGCPDEG
jgi:hypothetical protein